MKPALVALDILREEHNYNQDRKKAHEHKYFWSLTARWGAIPRSGGQGSEIYVVSSKPKENKSFYPGTRKGRPVTGVTGQSFMC